MPLTINTRCNFYCDMYQYDLDTLITINTISVFEIIGDMSVGLCRGFTFQNTEELKCIKAGTYVVNWNISFQDGNNKVWEGAVFDNEVIQSNTISILKLGSVDTGSFSGTGIIHLSVDDLVTLRIANLTNDSNATIKSASISLIRVDK